MTTIYEGMFLIDNAAVREDWNAAKTIITGTLEKHGATIHTARRWDERRLAYPIKKRNRATFLLTYFEIPGENVPAMRREFELNDTVLRNLQIAVDAIPEYETELAQAELSDDFVVPAPPEDDAVDEKPSEEGEESSEDGEKAKAEGDEKKSEGESSEEKPSEGTKAEADDETKQKEGAAASEEN